MKKIYRSESVFSTTFVIDGKRHNIDFYQTQHGSEYGTEDENVQDALEKSSMFGYYYRLLRTEQTENVPEKKTSPLEEVGGVMSCAEARDFLRTKGVKDFLQMKSKADIRSTAESLGYVFPNL